MTVLAIVLFGSRARGNEQVQSDADLLLVTNDKVPIHLEQANLSLAYYPLVKLESLALEGSLFLLHILREGKILYDPADILTDLRKRFQKLASYQAEIRAAADVAWCLIDNAPIIDSQRMLARRTAWAVRTILIARSVDKGRPQFASEELAALAKSPAAGRVIKQKDEKAFSVSVLDDLQTFLEEEGLERSIPRGSTVQKYYKLFVENKNSLGRAMLKSVDSVTFDDSDTYA